ncbi:MAG: hemolysin family protein, partial [Erysipelotrichales bacterium]
MKDHNRFLSTIQVGITLAGFLSSAFAASKLSGPLEELFRNLNVPAASTLAIFIVTLILSYFTLVFGELIPKRIALQKSEFIALKSARVINVCAKISAPFVKILSLSTNFFMRLLKIDTKEIEEQVTEEEISSLLEVGQKQGLFNESEKEMIEGIFSFDDLIAKDIMTSRKNAFFIDIDKPFTEYYEEIFENMYSRIPIYKDDIDNIVGVLYLKDLMRKSYEIGYQNIVLEDIMQEPYFISERKQVDVLLKELQENKTHMAILVDEYGTVSGIVTIEDVIEEIVGEIEDEFDKYDEIIKINDSNYYVKGYVTISDLNDALDIELNDQSDDYDTVAGLIIETLGDLPDEEGESVLEIEGITFTILKIEDNRIELVKVTK